MRDQFEITLQQAVVDYRAGHYDNALEVLRKPLLASAAQDQFSSRTLTFLAEITPEPTRRETASALTMVGAFVRRLISLMVT